MELEEIIAAEKVSPAEEEIAQAIDRQATPLQPPEYSSPLEASEVVYQASAGYGPSEGYRNVSRLINHILPSNFDWADLGSSIYGMFTPLTQRTTHNMSLKGDIAQLFRTHVHETVHRVMRTGSEYVVRTTEAWITGVTAIIDRYRPKRPRNTELNPAGI